MRKITIDFDQNDIQFTAITENGETCYLSETTAKDAENLQEIFEAFGEEAQANGQQIEIVCPQANVINMLWRLEQTSTTELTVLLACLDARNQTKRNYDTDFEDIEILLPSVIRGVLAGRSGQLARKLGFDFKDL